jgi:hypothetical protein
MYTRVFTKNPSSKTARDTLFKVKWLFKREEVEGLVQDLRCHIHGLEVFTIELGT